MRDREEVCERQQVEEDRRVGFSSEEMVVCADRCREIYLPWMGWKGQLSMTGYALIWPGLAVASGVKWLAAVGVVTLVVFVVVPTLIKSHRFFASLPCPKCGLPVKRYQTRQTRIHLCCEHCGHEAPTDCRINHNGGIPQKG